MMMHGQTNVKIIKRPSRQEPESKIPITGYNLELLSVRLTKYFFLIISVTGGFGGTRWRSWLRHCATSRKVVGSIPDGVTGFFH